MSANLASNSDQGNLLLTCIASANLFVRLLNPHTISTCTRVLPELVYKNYAISAVLNIHLPTLFTAFDELRHITI